MTIQEAAVVLMAASTADHGCSGCAGQVEEKLRTWLPDAPWDEAEKLAREAAERGGKRWDALVDKEDAVDVADEMLGYDWSGLNGNVSKREADEVLTGNVGL